ncbi:hypothetical protein [Francisella tularensis]|nr:hypothetical protein [Francisella tularensis]MDN9007130.1 hypothetical protein [Francisella tularensis subsp. mediasiatica]WKL72073.1 hypothetical protein Q1H03_07595 [Francisella tularensis subsp. mediasiatica]WKL77923.1 hypothetical protein Q1H04_03650 [Francisella tularensis subsp. mediasiatica]WKL79928.1 hypothetical protein Q1G99_05025 [Francisella tularensis subsp. mediasiatica]
MCLLIGAIISPTDPVTLFEVLKSNKNMPEKIKNITRRRVII